MRLTHFIGLCFLADLLSAQTWRKSLNVPHQGQKLGPLNSELPVVRFECTGRGGGYYGDMDFGCSIFHYCTADGTRYTFKCTKGLKFNEMTTSCSAGFFGDCSHPEVVGSAGRNISGEPAQVKSFQNIPVFKGEDKSYEDDPRDYPEPFIQHYDPALDLNYDYYEEDITPGLQDTQPSASNILPENNFIKSKSIWNTGMESALSAFASLVNVPLDSSSNAKARIDRMDHEDSPEYANNIDRSFAARPSLHGIMTERENLRQPLKYSNFKNGPKKTVGIGSFSGYNHNLIPVTPPPLYPVPPTEDYYSHNQLSNSPSSKQFQNIIPYNSKDLPAPRDESVHQTTPDTFRPSSLMTDNPDEFQPRPNSDDELPEHKRPYRQIPHQSDQGVFSSNFQSFSPTPGSFSSTRFPQGHTLFRGPPPSPSGGFEASGGFLRAPNFPRSGNFVFNQPPIQRAVFNAPFHPISPQSGPSLSKPRPLTRTTSSLSNIPPDHHTHFLRPAPPPPPPPPPPSGHSFVAPDEPVIFRHQSPQNDKTFLHSSSFINTPNHKPPTPPPVRNFIHHTTPSSLHSFGSTPLQNTFQSDLLTRPTPTPGFIPTPSSPFNGDHQNPFSLQHERPLLESFTNIVKPVDSTTSDLPLLFTKEPVHPDFAFPISSTRPSLLTIPESNTQGTLPVERPNVPPSFDPRPNRRRPVARRKPVSVANHQPVPFTTVSPIPFTTQQSPSFSKRPPSRAIRKNIANRFNDGTPTLVTGLEHSEFHSQFLQPDGRHPSSHSLQTKGVDTYTEFDDSQLREPDYPQSDDFATNTNSGKLFSDFAQTIRPENIDDSDNFHETEESNNIVEPGDDYEDVTDLPVTSPAPQSTTTQKPPVTFRGPLLRRRPNLRNRVRTRLPSRSQASSQPDQSNDNILSNNDKISSDDSETNNDSTLTTISPFRQRVQDRLNMFKEQKEGTKTSSSTTESPEEDDTSNSKSSPTSPRRLTSLRNTSSDRFQSYRNRLRSRLRNRTSRTTVAPDDPKDNENQSTPKPSSLLASQRNRRINPLKGRPDDDEESKDEGDIQADNSAAKDAVNVDTEQTEDSVGDMSHTGDATQLVKETNTDQQVQETTHSLVQKSPPSLDKPSDASSPESSNIEAAASIESFKEELPENAGDAGTDNTRVDENGSDNTKENTENLGNDQENADARRRRIINPNFRARFREFIKNRKSRVDDSTGEPTPDKTEEETEKKSNTQETAEVAQDENSNLSLKERMEHFNKNRESIRQRFLANRQTSDGDRSGRRIPLRPLRNKVVSESEKTSENLPGDDEIKSTSSSIPEAHKENNSDTHTQNTKRNSVLVNKVTDGFTPALSPIHVKSPMIEHLSLQGATTPVQETDIITAPPSTGVGDQVASIQVSASLGGDIKSTTKDEQESISDNPLPESRSEKEDSTLSILSEPEQGETQLEVSPDTKDVPKESRENDPDLEVNITQSESRSNSYLPSSKAELKSPKENPSGIHDSDATPQEEIKGTGKQLNSSNKSQGTEEEDSGLPDSSTNDNGEAKSSYIDDNKEDDNDNSEVTTETTRVSKPSFDLSGLSNKSSKSENSPISASDFSEDFTDSVTPVSLLPITMSTDPPKLPLEMLLPLFRRR